MGARGVLEALGRERRAHEVVAGFGLRALCGFAPRLDLADGGQARPIVALAQPCDVVAERGAARLDAPVVAINMLTRLEFVRLGGVVQIQAHILIQAALIALEREHIVPAPGGDGLGRRPLGVHGVRRHDPALERQHLQQLRHRRDLVGLVIDLHLAEHQAGLGGESLHQMHRRARSRLGEGTPQRLAVNGDDIAVQNRRPVLQKPQQHLVQAVGVQRVEQVRKRIVARNAVFQPHETAQKPLLGPTEPLHVRASLPAA